MKTNSLSTRTFIQRHSLAAYFGLAFLIAWVGGFTAVRSKFMQGEAMQFSDQLLIFLPMITGPCLAGIILTGIVDGKNGLRNLFSRMGYWHVPARWYAPILIFPIMILVVLFFLTSRVSPDYAPIFFPMGILVGLFAGFFEETGWTGFAYPRMQIKYCALVTAVSLGILHVTWHVLPDYLGASVIRGDYWVPHFLAMMLLCMTAMRVIIVWVYANTGSLLLAQLMHASSTGFLSVFVPGSISPAQSTLWYAVYGLILWIVVIVIAGLYGKNLVRSRKTSANAISHPLGTVEG